MALKVYAKSTENQHQKKDAKMMPKCSKMGTQGGHEIDKML